MTTETSIAQIALSPATACYDGVGWRQTEDRLYALGGDGTVWYLEFPRSVSRPEDWQRLPRLPEHT